ncbi:MAG: hypothetical protein J6N21_05470 [Butyrivibrio sp.]|nr:hypothetical protein [Butyrivibrio sp.]
MASSIDGACQLSNTDFVIPILFIIALLTFIFLDVNGLIACLITCNLHETYAMNGFTLMSSNFQ